VVTTTDVVLSPAAARVTTWGGPLVVTSTQPVRTAAGGLTVLGPIVERLRDERYLFFLGVVLVIGTVSFFAVNSTFAWGVLGRRSC
jgi:hypothetical protein